MTPERPTPGSREAIDLGCTCPVMDNDGGRGFVINGETCFWFTQGCPVHGRDEPEPSTENQGKDPS